MKIQHPSEYLGKGIVEVLRARSMEAEQSGKLHPDQEEIIFKENWFRMFVPKEYGGTELSLPEILHLEEALAWVDGSVGWVVTLCSGAGWFIGFLDQSTRDEFFRTNNVCIAGSGAIGGVAELTNDGFEINGRWKYASGSPQASAFTANCLLQKKGKQLTNLNGTPKISAFIFKRHEVEINETWNTTGMIATASHSFRVDNLNVASARGFIIDPEQATLPQPVFQYPFLQLAETTLAVNLSGMTIHLIDMAELHCDRKISNPRAVQQPTDAIKKARLKISHARQSFFEVIDQSWRSILEEKSNPLQLLTQVSEVSNSLVQTSRIIVNSLFPFCGLSVADKSHPINKVWRDFHTASQHSLFRNSL